MADDIDEIARALQEAILEGYSEKFKQEFSNPKNIGKIEDADSRVSITGVCGDTVEMYLALKDGKINVEIVENFEKIQNKKRMSKYRVKVNCGKLEFVEKGNVGL